MTLKVGQIRKDDISSNYFTKIENISYTSVDTTSPFAAEDDENQSFTDFAIIRTSSGNNSSTTFEQGKVYYLRFKIQRVPQYYYSGKNSNYALSSNSVDKLNYSLTLREGENEKILTSFSVPIVEKKIDIGNNQESPYPDQPDYYLFETIFSPTVSSSQLVFKLDRIAYDVFEQQRNWLIQTLPAQSDILEREDGSRAPVYIQRFSDDRLIINDDSEGTILCELNNIMPASQSYWKKFGFQSRPSALIVINKQPFRVGRSGICEINNGIRINNFMIAPSSGNDIDHFLLDYIAVTENDAEGGT